MNSKTVYLVAISTISAILYILLVPIIMIWATVTIDENTSSTGEAIGLINPPNMTEVVEPVSLGTFTVTHYCPCKSCSPWGITYTGTVPEVGRTIAVDPAVIPLGSTVIIDGQAYTAEDTGGAIKGMRVDMFVGDHQEALGLGVKEMEVFMEGGKIDVNW